MSDLYLHCEDNDGGLIEQAKSQFDNCPACGTIDHLELINATMDDPQFQIFCRPCQFLAAGETAGEAVENWNKRIPEIARLTAALEAAERGLKHYANKRLWREVGVNESGIASTFTTFNGNPDIARKCLAEIAEIKGSKPESGSRENPK